MPPLLPRERSGGGRTHSILFTTREQRRSHPGADKSVQQPRAYPHTHTHTHRCTRKMLANRGESVRKLVELQPLPVIKSKERRRYGRRAWLAAEYEKGGEGSYYTLTMFKRGCVSFDRARLISKFPISLHFSLSVDIDREKIRRALINGKRRNSNIGG